MGTAELDSEFGAVASSPEGHRPDEGPGAVPLWRRLLPYALVAVVAAGLGSAVTALLLADDPEPVEDAHWVDCGAFDNANRGESCEGHFLCYREAPNNCLERIGCLGTIDSGFQGSCGRLTATGCATFLPCCST